MKNNPMLLFMVTSVYFSYDKANKISKKLTLIANFPVKKKKKQSSNSIH